MTQSPRPAPRPNIFVVGDAKCGTTSLYRMIQLTPGIETARTRKELHYFSEPEIMARLNGPGDARIPPAIIHDEAAYLAEFAHIPDHVRHIADVSPSYLQNTPAAARIAAFAPDARIVILLRDPAAKVFSQYTHLWSEDREPLPFEAAFAASPQRRRDGYSDMFDYAGGGRYAEAVECYFDTFGRDAVRVEIFETLFGEDPGPRRALGVFLGVDFGDSPPPQANVSGKPKPGSVLGAALKNPALRGIGKRLLPPGLRIRLDQALGRRVAMDKPVLAEEMRARLQAHFAEDARRLETLLGRETGWPTARA